MKKVFDEVEGFVADNRGILDTGVEIALITTYDFIMDENIKTRDIIARTGIKFITRPVIEMTGYKLNANEIFFVEMAGTSAYDQFRNIFDIKRLGFEVLAHFIAPIIADKIIEVM